jgi:tetratricopeptide (TPR) repeat protein
MGRIDFFLGVFLCSLAIPVPTPGFLLSSVLENANSSVAGSVNSGGTNQRIPQARVALCDEGGALVAESITGDSGEFSFQGLRPAHYILRITAAGFEPTELSLDLIYTSERGITVALTPSRAAPASPHSSTTISAHELALPQGARKLLDSGKQKLNVDKDAQAALRDFQAATQQAPDFYEAYYETGMAYLALQNSVEAEIQFRKSVDLSQKKFPDANIALGTLLLHRNEITEGESLLRIGISGNPRSWPGQFELAQLELSRDRVDLALAAARQAASLAPQQPVVHRLLAIIYLRQKDYPALASALDAYIALDPDSPAGVRAKELRAQTQRHLENSPAEAAAVK